MLILLGPPGWFVLAVLAVVAGRRESLVVRIPYSDVAFRDELRYRRFKLVALAAGVVSLVLAFGFEGMAQGGVWLVLAGLCFATAVVCHVRTELRAVRVSLDASRRWVTLSNVHQRFVEATCAAGNGARSAR